MINFIKRYWSLFAAGIAGLMYVLFRAEQMKNAELETDNQTARAEGQLDQTRKDATHATEQAAGSSADYDSLKRDNAELCARIGLGSHSDPGGDRSHN